MTENREKILRLIEATIHPTVMSKQEAADFLDQLIEDLETSRDAVKDELQAEADKANG